MNEREADRRRIDGCCTRLDLLHGDATSPRIPMREIVLLTCCALHAIMLLLAIGDGGLGWTVFWLLALCLDIYSLGESRL
ncbi:MAG: hypothetical protein ACLROE_08115 [Collinsella intestinalis]|uniref:Uncharacterized protein n=1 Tax=Collinsella intestinalis TaxID=147207 RepID=A0A6N3AYN3_9ACTN